MNFNFIQLKKIINLLKTLTYCILVSIVDLFYPFLLPSSLSSYLLSLSHVDFLCFSYCFSLPPKPERLIMSGGVKTAFVYLI